MGYAEGGPRGGNHKGKDASLCSSYRSISLLNPDTKIFAKVLAVRLKIVMNDLVHTDHVGFIPGKESRDNKIKTLLAVQEIKESKAPGLLLLIDAEKSSDRVDWSFMQSTLEAMGLGPNMTHWIKAILTYLSQRP